MVHHLGIGISDPGEVKRFYENVLGFELKYDFQVIAERAKIIFGIEKFVKVYAVVKNELKIELFEVPENKVSHVNHVCLVDDGRDEMYQKASDSGYWCVKVLRTDNNGEVYFIKDKEGNLFELKDSSQIG